MTKMRWRQKKEEMQTPWRSDQGLHRSERGFCYCTTTTSLQFEHTRSAGLFPIISVLTVLQISVMLDKARGTLQLDCVNPTNLKFSERHILRRKFFGLRVEILICGIPICVH